MVRYTYDAVGNRLSMTDDEGVVYYDYNEADMLLTSGDVQYIYDSNGNLVSKNDSGKTTEYKYDTRNLLTEVDNPNTSYVKYGYDALGRKVYRQEAQADMDKLETLYGNGNSGSTDGNGSSNGNENSGNSGTNNGNGNGNSGNNNNGNSGNNGKGSNAGGNGNGYGKYNNPGQGNKYGIYKNGSGDIEIPLTIEAERYQYLGQTTLLNKEYSDKGAPYAEYHIANSQVISQKMFGLHGLVTPGKEDTLNTNGGLMYYQYDGAGSVTELTNRQGEEIEHYRYDAFGNIFTGITSPYNTTVYTGQDYDDLAGLVQMDARWYAPNLGRFTSQDSYAGDTYNPQSLNRYSYVMNNPVNMWDPTGHVPEWVGKDTYITYLPDTHQFDELYFLLKDRSGSSSSEWYFIEKTTTGTEDIYKYMATIINMWVYDHYKVNYYDIIDPETGDYAVDSVTENTVTFRETNYYYNNVVVKAVDKAAQNEEKIKDQLGNPPENTDSPAVSIWKEYKGPMHEWDLGEVIVTNTGAQTTGAQSQVTGTVQSMLNDIMNIDLTVKGIYEDDTAGAVADLQEALNLTANGELDVNTFYQLMSIYAQYSWYNDMLSDSSSNREELARKQNELVGPFRHINVMSNLVTVQQLIDFGWIDPTQQLADEINEALSMFGINEGEHVKEQIIAFMATAGHEAGMGGYNYIQSGSKSDYRGTGALQLTGQYNYGAFDQYLKDHLDGYNGEIMTSAEPYKVVADKYAWISAAWYWTEGKDIKSKLDRYMDSGYELYDSFIVTTAYVQGLRGGSEDYKKIAAGQYEAIDYFIR